MTVSRVVAPTTRLPESTCETVVGLTPARSGDVGDRHAGWARRAGVGRRLAAAWPVLYWSPNRFEPARRRDDGPGRAVQRRDAAAAGPRRPGAAAAAAPPPTCTGTTTTSSTWCSSGEAEHVVNGERHRLGPGSGFLLSPADFHEIRATGHEPLTCLNTVIDPGADGGAAGRRRTGRARRLPLADRRLRRRRAGPPAAPAELEEPRLGSRRVVEALVACLVVELARRRGGRRAQARRGAPGGEDDLRAAVLFVDRHFREPLTLADVAAQAHLSPNYFSERFRLLHRHPVPALPPGAPAAVRPLAAGRDRPHGERGLPRLRLQQPLALRARLPTALRRRSVGPLGGGRADVTAGVTICPKSVTGTTRIP